MTSRGVAGSLAALEMSGKSSEDDNDGMYAALVDYLPRSAATLTKIDMRRAAAPPISTVAMLRCIWLVCCDRVGGDDIGDEYVSYSCIGDACHPF